MSPFKNKLEELFGFDLRSLAALRIAVALLIIGDLISRSRDLVAHYTDFGVVPRGILGLYDRWRVSVHLMNGTWEVQAVLFLITGIFALMLLVGYRTRVMTAVLWFLLSSLDSRNPFIADGGDTLLRLTLFWAFFMPWGACYSVDRSLAPVESTVPQRIFSAATFAYSIQIVIIYVFSVIHKTSPEWRSDGTAVYYALHLIQMANPIGAYLAQFPLMMRLVTHGVFWFQVIGPAVLFFPLWNGPIRTAAVFAFMLMHVGMGLCLQIGLFSWIAAFAMLVFLPPWFWDRILSRLRTPARIRTRIYYDQECGFCSRWVRLLQTFALIPETRILAAQSDSSIETDMNHHNSWVVVDETGSRHFRAQALRVIVERSPLLGFLAPLFKPAIVLRLGNVIYARIADHRRSLCPIDPSRAMPQASKLKLPLEVNVLVLALLTYVFAWNFSNGPLAKFQMSERWRSIGYVLRLDQIWNPFSPSPPKASEWYVIAGKLKDGKVLDLLRNGDNPSMQPTREHFSNYRWRKYFEIVGKPNNLDRLRDYARYACRDWNRRHNAHEKVIELEIDWLIMQTLPNNEIAKPEAAMLLKHRCDESSSNVGPGKTPENKNGQLH
jgi:predicted DCC family thiol-disulfide oxidoreductase YuxK